MNMHHYWVGLAADLWRAGDKSCEWILKDAAAGEVFAAGHAESGNDTSAPLVDVQSRTRRRRLQIHRAQIVRQPYAGLDEARRARDGHERSQGAEGRPRVPGARHGWRHDQGNVGRARHAGDTQRRHRARGRILSRPLHRASHCRQVQQGWMPSSSASSPGHC